MTLSLTKSEKIYGGVFLLLQMLVIPGAVTALCIGLGIASEAAVNLICFFLNAALALWIFRRLLQQSWQNCAGRWGRTALTVLEGFGLYWLLSTAALVLILALRPDYANLNDASVNTMIDEFPVLMPLAVVLAAPLAEECLFRGWMFTGLAQKSLPLAYLVTAGCFSAVHLVNYIGSYDGPALLLSLLQYLGPSLALCRTCHKSDSLLAPLLLHSLINTIALFTTR